MLIGAADYFTARDCSMRALAAGADSTWHLLRLSYIAYHTSDSLLGEYWFGRAVDAANDIVARRELGWHLDFRNGNPYIDASRKGWQHNPQFVLDQMTSATVAEWLTQDSPAARRRWVAQRADSASRAGVHSLNGVLQRHFSTVMYAGGAFRGCNRSYLYLDMTYHLERGILTRPVRALPPPPVPPCFPDLPADVHVIRTQGARYRLWDTASDAPVTVATYTAPLDDLVFLERGGKPTASLQIELREQEGTSASWQDSTIAKQFLLPSSDKHGALQGILITPRAPDASSWSIGVYQDDNRRGIVDGHVDPLGEGSVVLSDVVLGDTTQHMMWKSGDDAIALAPVGTLPRTSPAELFVQTQSASAHSAVRTTYAIYKWKDEKRDGAPVLQISSVGPLAAGIRAVHRTLDLSRLHNGVYQLEMQLKGEGVDARRTAMLVVR